MLDSLLNVVRSLPVWLQIIIFLVCLVVGVFCLVKFCDIFVDASSDLAKKFKISPLIIGLTIVAIGTSCPELAVSVSDSINVLTSGGGAANVALGNVVGSNICNILLVLGFSCVFTPIVVDKSVCKREFPFLLGVTILLVIFGIFFGLNSVFDLNDLVLTRWEGIIFVVLCVVYLVFIVLNAKKDKLKSQLNEEEREVEKEVKEVEAKEEKKEKNVFVLIVLIIVGAIGIALGGELVVFGAKGLAYDVSDALGFDKDLTEALIGLTIVAVGTSLPELVTSCVAAKKGENELALGNVIGSNIFNILFVAGISATICPLSTGSQIIVDLLVMLAVSIIAFIMSLKGKLKRSDGIILLVLYVLYLTYLIIRTIIG